jgi:hypothetical protein
MLTTLNSWCPYSDRASILRGRSQPSSRRSGEANYCVSANTLSCRDVIAGQWNSAINSILPTMLAFSASRSPAGIQYSRMVWPPTWWTS